MAEIHRREDVNPAQGRKLYGDVTFADPVNHKYPIDTAEHVRAAWSYINHPANAAKYGRPGELAAIRERITRAAGKVGVDVDDDGDGD